MSKQTEEYLQLEVPKLPKVGVLGVISAPPQSPAIDDLTGLVYLTSFKTGEKLRPLLKHCTV
jgi:hypothetical protein